MAKMKMYIQSHGHFENDAELNVGLINIGNVDNKTPQSVWQTDIPSLTVLIHHEDVGWILYDTTSHPDNLKGHWPERLCKLCPHYLEPEDTLEAKLKLLDLKPSDIDLLILSHLHMDHAGNLFLFKDTKAGQNIIIHEKELREALYLTHVGLEKNVGAYVRDDFVMPGISFSPVDEDLRSGRGNRTDYP